ncbi:MAG: thiamine-binding protein [Firmicutes bacterium]|nr:thiamine-binding protein [Bacillota bacterium]
MLTAEVSLYPLEAEDSDEIINDSLQALMMHGLETEVGPVSTRLAGPPDQVWAALRRLYERAEAQGREVAMVIQLTNGV